MKKSIEYFHKCYEKEGDCWIWKRCKNKGGYGKIGLNDLAHRRSYEYHKGNIPFGQCVLHKCDNRDCVNPEHLFLGDRSTNNKDRKEKNRSAKGESHGQSKLDEKSVFEIRKKRMQGCEYQQLSEQYKVNWYTIRKICKNQIWKHVELGEECKEYVSPANGHRRVN